MRRLHGGGDDGAELHPQRFEVDLLAKPRAERLQGAPRVGRKKAEQLILDLSEKMDDLLPESGRRPLAVGTDAVAEDAVRALVSLGYAVPDAERAVKAAIDSGGKGMNAPDLIREALKKVTDARR